MCTSPPFGGVGQLIFHSTSASITIPRNSIPTPCMEKLSKAKISICIWKLNTKSWKKYIFFHPERKGNQTPLNAFSIEFPSHENRLLQIMFFYTIFAWLKPNTPRTLCKCLHGKMFNENKNLCWMWFWFWDSMKKRKNGLKQVIPWKLIPSKMQQNT